MPCNDITEIVKLTLDSSDRITDYSLHKEMCGGSVAGRGLIRDLVKQVSVDNVLALSPAEAIDGYERDETLTYLRLKHLFTIQSLLREYTGVARPQDSNLIEMLSVEQSEAGIALVARVALDALTDRIRACGLCNCESKPQSEP